MYLMSKIGSQGGLKIKDIRIYANIDEVYRIIMKAELANAITRSWYNTWAWSGRVYEVQADGSLKNIKTKVMEVIKFFRPHY